RFEIADSWNGQLRDVSVALGPGANRFELVAAPGAVLYSYSRLGLDIAGNSGPDTVVLNMPERTVSAAVQVRADLGGGDDVLTLHTGQLEGNDARLAVHAILGAGTNRVELTSGGGALAASVSATLELDVEGGPGTDRVFVNLAGGQVGYGRVFVNAELGAGNDEFRAAVDLQTFLLDPRIMRFRVNGGAGNEVLAFTATSDGNPGGLRGLLDVNFLGGAGADVLSVDLGGAGLRMTGPPLRVRADGGAGNDVLNLALRAAPESATDFDVSLSGGPGSDRLTAQGVNDRALHTPEAHPPARP